MGFETFHAFVFYPKQFKIQATLFFFFSVNAHPRNQTHHLGIASTLLNLLSNKTL